MEKKQFRVSDIKQMAENVTSLLLISPDGKAYQIIMSNPTYKVGELIEVPFEEDALRWDQIEAEHARAWPLAQPYRAVSNLWGEDVAIENDVPILFNHGTRLVTPSIVFTPDDFKNTPHVTREYKADFAKALVKFIENGCKKIHLSNRLYDELKGRFGFSGERSKDVFYDLRFSNSQRKLASIRMMSQHLPIGDPEMTMQDVEKAIRAWVTRAILPKVTTTATNAENIRERLLLDELIKKHGVPDWLKLPMERPKLK